MFQELPTTVGASLDYSVRTWPERVALRENDRVVTYRELAERVDQTIADLHAAGVSPGDHVAYLMAVGQRWVEILYALAKLGAVAVPLNLTWTAEEVLQGLDLTDSQVLIIGPDHRGVSLVDLVASARTSEAGQGAGGLGLARVRSVLVTEQAPEHPWIGRIGKPGVSTIEQHEPVPNVVPGDVAVLLLSSGSTSFPKPVVHTHRSFMAGVVSYSDGLEIAEDDVFVHTTPSYHVGGAITVVGPLMRGGSVRLMDWFEPERTMRFIEQDRATLIWGFETHFNAMRTDVTYGDHDLSSISRTMVAANPVAAAKVLAMGFDHVGSLYGSTEYMGSQAFFPFRDRYDRERMTGSHGRPLTGEIRIIDPETGDTMEAGVPGEICVSGPALFSGYYGMPDATAECMDANGFFHSGDVGHLDRDGYLYYRGRYKEVIKTGGENVSASEVEQFMVGEVPGIERAVVVGVSDPRWGEAVVAVVEADASEISSEAIREACRGRLAGYKVPKNVVFVHADDWVVTPTGKLDRAHVQVLAESALRERSSTSSTVSSC